MEELTAREQGAGSRKFDSLRKIAARTGALLLLGLFATSTPIHGAINQSCKAGAPADSLIRIHGRLGVYNGGYPNLRLWHIGTHHLFGIYGNPQDLRCSQSVGCDGNSDTLLPSNLEHLDLLDSWAYGDFEIRLLEPFQPGHMQPVCIVSAQHLVVQR